MKVLIFATHPIQYQVPIYRELSKHLDLKVIYLLKQTKKGQADAGFGVEFEWDIPLLDGYHYEYLTNLAKQPSSSTYNGIVLDKKELTLLFKKENPKAVIIHGWFPKGMKQIIDYSYRNKIPSFCRGDSTLLMTGNPIKKCLKEIYIRTILRKINYFLYVGTENKKYYQHYGVSTNRLFPAFHCINTPYFIKEYHEHKFLKDADFINIGFVGKFIDIKNPFILLNAIKNSRNNKIIKLKLVGDGFLKDEIINFCKINRINYEFIGFLNQTQIVKQGYSDLDLLVMPSFSETWGLVVNEVMTGGIPCIVSDKVGCSSDLIIEGKTGFIFENNNAEELLIKLDMFIEKIKSGYSFKHDVLSIIENYSLENTVRGYLEALFSLKNNLKNN